METEQLKNDFDAVILASGENSKESGIEFSETGYTTNQKGIFACGSVISPVKMAVKVVAQGKAAAYAVHSFLSGNLLQTKLFNSRFGKLREEEITTYLKESKPGERNEPSNGNQFGFNKEEAIAEAKRCLRCDCRKSHSCKLRIYANDYKANQLKFKFASRKSITKHFQQEKLVYEAEKCIKCGLCIEILAKNKDLTGLTYIGRGFDMHIAVPFDKSLQQAIANAADECIKTCPTAALSAFSGEDEFKINEVCE